MNFLGLYELVSQPKWLSFGGRKSGKSTALGVSYKAKGLLFFMLK